MRLPLTPFSLQLRGQEGSRQDATRTLPIHQRHTGPLYRRVTNWPPPRRSSPHPKSGCQLWQAEIWPSSRILPSAPLCLMLNTVIFRAEDTPTPLLLASVSLDPSDQIWPASYFLFPLPTLSQNIMLKHETITKYKSPFLLLGHSDCPSTPSHLFSLSPPSLPYSLFLALYLTQTQL